MTKSDRLDAAEIAEASLTHWLRLQRDERFQEFASRLTNGERHSLRLLLEVTFNHGRLHEAKANYEKTYGVKPGTVMFVWGWLMLTCFEERRRHQNNLYRVRSVYLFGVLVWRRWEQLTTRDPLPSERE